MSRIPEGAGSDRQQLNVVARRVLLDALEALHDQRNAVVVVGAQAVFMRSSAAGGLVVPTYTSDADLGLDPALLEPEPLIEEAMHRAGFHPDGQPGTWVRAEQIGAVTANIAVDLLVPETFAGDGGRRSVRIPPHDKLAARRVIGLEAALVNHDTLTITSLEPVGDGRAIVVKVAGVAALLIAKAFKIGDRLGEAGRHRLTDKDAGDVIRLMQASDPDEIGEVFQSLAAHPTVGEVRREGLAKLRGQFAGARTPGTEMAAAALAGAVAEATVRALAPAWIAALPPVS